MKKLLNFLVVFSLFLCGFSYAAEGNDKKNDKTAGGSVEKSFERRPANPGARSGRSTVNRSRPRNNNRSTVNRSRPR
ncbi:hypothetical protein OAK75_02625, partial [Bacteriovoracales bacterium]|nr:hypothetical protein [Bacteriovoracales bacterium]